jgi:branched-chain amino acid transport system permease protein
MILAKKQWQIALAVALISVVPWVWDSGYIFHIGTMTAIMIPLAASMNLMLKVGQLSLAHAAFYGIGAYASALLSMRLGLPPVLALLSGGVFAAVIAGVLGPIILRIKGVYFVLLTFAITMIVNLVMQDWVSLTNGNSGLYGIPKLSILGVRLTKIYHYYSFALTFAAITFAVLWAIEKSDIGAIFQSMEENDMVSRSLGGNVIAWRVAAFVLSAFIAGICGGIYAFYIGFLSPDPFGFRMLVDLIVVNTVGGPSTVFGPLIGSIIIVPLPEVLRDAQQYQLMIYGLCLIFFILFFRRGLVALIGLDKRSD